ncbi:MAG: hypothetical protein K8T10_15085 [Candidatus Eremiobacteraeota bacterium]|nr:hypothetical protein [Candidatus Eremiobacteraeota bacterium]
MTFALKNDFYNNTTIDFKTTPQFIVVGGRMASPRRFSLFRGFRILKVNGVAGIRTHKENHG